MSEITICQHVGKYEIAAKREHPQIPLVFTFAWDGYERWCPWCGSKFDIFGGKSVPATPELLAMKKAIAVATTGYLAGVRIHRLDPDMIPAEHWELYQEFKAAP